MPRVPVPGDVRHLELEFCGPREGLEIIPRILLRGEPGEVKKQGLPPSRRWIGKCVCDLQEGCPLWGQSLITFSSVYKRRLKPWTLWPCLPGKGGSIGPNVHHLVSSPVPVVRGLCGGGLLVAEACEGRVGPPSGPSVTPFPRVGFLSALPAPASNFTLHSPFRLRRASSPLSCSYDHDPVAFPLQRDRASLLSRFPLHFTLMLRPLSVFCGSVHGLSPSPSCVRGPSSCIMAPFLTTLRSASSSCSLWLFSPLRSKREASRRPLVYAVASAPTERGGRTVLEDL